MISRWLDSGLLRVLAYGGAAAGSLLAGVRERNSGTGGNELWPTFWFLTAGVLVVMALARVGNIGGLISDFGRSQAQAGGWYADRRSLQTIAVAIVGLAWLTTVTAAIWRVPERRRRYLPTAIAVFSLMCFGAVRAVSLHDIDGLLYRRPIHGVRIASLIELVGTLLAMLLTAWHPFATTPPSGASATRATGRLDH